MNADTLAVATFANKSDNQPRQRHVTWDQLVKVLTHHQEREEKDGPLWSPTLYVPAMTRGKANVVAVSCLVQDYDHDADPNQFAAGWGDLAYILHTTYSHSAAEPRWRAIFPFTQPVPAEAWPHLWSTLTLRLGGATADKSCKDCSRIYYLPSCAPGAPKGAHVNPGRWLDPAPFLRPAVELLVSRAKEHLGEGRNNAGLWLACQLRDNGYNQRETENARWHLEVPYERALADGRVDAYTEEEWLDTVRKVYNTSARDPWTLTVRSTATVPPLREEPEARREFNLTDEGMAERLVYHYGNELRYCFPTQQWLLWSGTHWQPDQTLQIEHLVVNVARHVLRQAAEIDIPERRQSFIRHARDMESRRGINAALDLARKHLPVQPAELDRDPLLINVKNGTFDVRAGKLKPHSREDLIACLCPAAYHPEAQDDRLDAFLSAIVDYDQDLLDFLQRSTGYSATGDVSAKALFLVIGPPGTGKTTFTEATSHALGTYARNADFETFLVHKEAGEPRPDIARLAGARFVYALETDAGKSLASGKVKVMTGGGDMMTARFLYGREFEFVPRFKLWLGANDAPRVSYSDDALWERIQRLPFLHRPERRDTGLLDHFRDQAAPALLRWMLDGATQWYRHGLGTAAAVEQARIDYRAEMDPFSDFFADHCEFSDEVAASAGQLWVAYQENTPLKMQGTRREMLAYLRSKGFDEHKTTRGKRVWRGVGLIAKKGSPQSLFEAD